MHVYFLGIGGAGIAPLAQIANQAGHQVSGSDKQETSYIDYLKKHGLDDIVISDNPDVVSEAHERQPIDWLVYSSAVAMEDIGKRQLEVANLLGIKVTKRDQFISDFTDHHKLKMIAIAGTHGKTTTTAMTIWLFLKLNQPISYLLPAKVSFGDMAAFDADSQYFVYEADEYDRNFLAYKPKLSLISGVSWDHHEIYPTRDDYIAAFKDFVSQSEQTLIWEGDAKYLSEEGSHLKLLREDELSLDDIKLKGLYNRRDGWLAISAVASVVDVPVEELVTILNKFPGLSRRMEEIYPNLFSDYAHTPDKIRGAISAASEIAAANGQPLVVIYEPLTNRRQVHMINDYKDCFKGATHVYWLPSYLGREDPNERIIMPEELIAKLADPTIAEPMERDQQLVDTIEGYLAKGHMVVAMAGGGGDSLDDWLRDNFTIDHQS